MFIEVHPPTLQYEAMLYMTQYNKMIAIHRLKTEYLSMFLDVCGHVLPYMGHDKHQVPPECVDFSSAA